MENPLLLGIDVGTSSTKITLINEAGEVVFTTAPEYAFETPRPGWAESNPEDWWDAVVEGLGVLFKRSGIGPEAIAGMGLTGQMHGLVLLDGDGRVLRPCIMWNDQRTAPQCSALTQKLGVHKIVEHTGNPLLAGFTAPKIAWVRENEPEVWAKAARVLLPKDYIRYRLSGEFFTDVSDASGTSLFDVAGRVWSPEMLAACGVPRAMLPEVTESAEASTKVSEAAARATGLRAGTPIIAGGGDQAAQAVGCGIVREGVVSCTLGTSGVVFAHSESCRVEPGGRLHAFCAAVPGQWHLMGVMLSAAGSYQWYRGVFDGEEARAGRVDSAGVYAVLEEAAGRVPAGAEGLLFLPYLSGERTPHADPHARGAFVGLSLRHGKAHLTRAVLEGVSYGLCDSLELMRGLGIEPGTVVASGGGAKSPLWRQMLADIFRAPIATVNATEGAAYGAALLAGVGAGVYRSIQDGVDRTLTVTPAASPGPAAAVYRDFYPRYRALYPALKGEYGELARTVAKHFG